MPAGPRQLLEGRFEQISAELEALFVESRELARREFAEQLNQAVRRLRLARDADELCATLSDAAGRYAAGALLFRIEDGVARNARIDVPLSGAPALAAATEMSDPLVALPTAAELSAPLVEMLGHDDSARAHLFPVTVEDKALALVYAWGPVQSAAIELLTQTAAAMWHAFRAPEPEPAPAPAQELVNIEAAPAGPDAQAAAQPKTSGAWADLSAADQQLHLRAQRFARVLVAEIRLKHAEAVQSGRTRRDLYSALRQPIESARQAFHEQFFSCPSMVDYLDLELTRTLAHEDPALLGHSYPGPLV